MQKKQKHMRTGRIEKWRRRDRWAIPVILLCMTLPFLLPLTATGNLTVVNLLAIIPFSYYGSLTFCIIYYTISRSMKRAAIKRATYNVIEDFDYYREKLSGLSPVTISILMDLEIEPEKDIAASVLRLTLLGVLSPEGKVLDANRPGVLPSDEPILSGILSGGMTVGDKMSWRKKAVEESVAGGYVQKQTRSFSDSQSGCLAPIIKIIVLLIIMGVMIRVFHMDEGMDLVNAVMEVKIEAYQNNPRFLALYFQGLLLMTVGYFLVVWPYMSWIASVFPRDAEFSRTREGEIVTERIAGMKNFLRDFSGLSEAHKHQLVLWDDFLIYAVVLEENRMVVDEILSMKGLAYRTVEFI